MSAEFLILRECLVFMDISDIQVNFVSCYVFFFLYEYVVYVFLVLVSIFQMLFAEQVVPFECQVCFGVGLWQDLYRGFSCPVMFCQFSDVFLEGRQSHGTICKPYGHEPVRAVVELCYQLASACEFVFVFFLVEIIYVA